MKNKSEISNSKEIISKIEKESGKKLERKDQVEQYSTLPIYKSSRGIATLFFSASILITIFLSFISDAILLEEVLFSLVVYVPLIFSIYKGYRGAMIAMMVLWVAEKIGSMILFESAGISSIIFLIIGLQVLWQALSVENIRKKELKGNRQQVQLKKQIGNFCSQCGQKKIGSGVFCTECGNKY